MAVPAPPTNVTATVDSNSQITVSWEHDPTWFAFDGDDNTLGGFSEGRWFSSDNIDSFEIQITRDAMGWVSPSGGASSVSHDGSNSYSVTYSPDSDSSYKSQIGIDSMFKFRVKASNGDGSSGWAVSGKVYTDPIPPHNPSVNRPDGTTFEISYTVQTNIPDIVIVQQRIDTGNGYSSWENMDYIVDPDRGQNVTATYNAGENYNYTTAPPEDSRSQFRLRSYNNEGSNIRRSEYVYADYGNKNNVYFEDDFESNDLSSWDSTNLAGESGIFTASDIDDEADLGISGADEGTYFAQIDSGGSITKNLGDLSSESDVIVKCAMAAGSMDTSYESINIGWYDGNSWNRLKEFSEEYNEQGWVEVTVLVPDSLLSTDNRLQLEGYGGSGDYGAWDRVVVSDILHEYTRPSTPSNLSLETSVEREITSTWTENSTFSDVENGGKAHAHNTVSLYLNGSRVEVDWPTKPITSYTHSLLNDGEKYEVHINPLYEQMRHGSESDTWTTSRITKSGTTILPPASIDSIKTKSDTAIDATWTDNANNRNGFEVYYRKIGTSTWNKFSDLGSNSASETITSLNQNTEYEIRVDVYTEHSTTKSSVSSGTTNLNESRSTATHSRVIDSDSIRTIDSFESISSHGSKLGSKNLRVVDVFEDAESHSKTISSDSVRIIDIIESVSSYSNAFDSSNHLVIDLGYNTKSHSVSSSSESKRVVDLLLSPLSRSDQMTSTTKRSGIEFDRTTQSYSVSSSSDVITVVDLLESISSSASISGGDTTRSKVDYEGRESDSFSGVLESDSTAIIDVFYGVESESKQSRTSVYNDRTSLEVLDHEMTWNDSENVWYTNWFTENRITGNEDQMAVRSLVIEDAKKPAAVVTVQYDGSGNNTVDAESEPIDLGRDQSVMEVEGIPIDEDGQYRIKIMEYSGYNSLYELDSAIVH